MAPEVIMKRMYSKACDVWGAGVMLYVLLSGRLPFLGSGIKLEESIAKGKVSVRFHSILYNLVFFNNNKKTLCKESYS